MILFLDTPGDLDMALTPPFGGHVPPSIDTPTPTLNSRDLQQAILDTYKLVKSTTPEDTLHTVVTEHFTRLLAVQAHRAGVVQTAFKVHFEEQPE